MILRLSLLFSGLITLAVVHIVALKFFLYWKYLWLDVPVHILGGVCVALGISALPFLHISLPKFFETRSGYVCGIIIVGTVWEIFEYVSGVSLIDEHFLPDTLLDYGMDVVGVLLGYGIVKNIQKLEHI